jgi:hypothetical protein
LVISCQIVFDPRKLPDVGSLLSGCLRPFFAENNYEIVSGDGLQAAALYVDKRLDGCPSSTAAIQSMIIHCTGEVAVKFVDDSPA